MGWTVVLETVPSEHSELLLPRQKSWQCSYSRELPIQVGIAVLFQAIAALLGEHSSLLFGAECSLKVSASCQCSGNNFVEKALSLSASDLWYKYTSSILKYSSLVFCCIVFKITFAVRKLNFSNLLFKKKSDWNAKYLREKCSSNTCVHKWVLEGSKMKTETF